MQGVTYAGSDYLSLQSLLLVIEYLHDLSNKLHSVMAGIVKSAHEGADVGCPHNRA